MKIERTVGFILLFFVNFCYSQNLVLNPSFEDKIQCPLNPSKIYYAKFWFQPNLGFAVNVDSGSSTDYYNSCSGITSFVSIPQNFEGYQDARTGYAYAGIGVYWGHYGGNSREYLEGQLSEGLKAGNKYCVQFFVSLSDVSDCSIDVLGIYFSQDSLLVNNTYTYILENPQVVNQYGNVIKDTENWVSISGIFVAQGGERFFTIGNFNDDFNTTIDTVNSPATGSYYYIDDVSVVVINEDSAHAGKDTIICKGQGYQLGSSAVAGMAYYWSPSISLDDSTKAQPLASPTATTTYILTVIDTSYATACRGSVTAIDSITIIVKDCTPPPPVYTNKLYPNLNDGIFTLEYNLQSIGVFNLYDVLGQVVLRQGLSEEKGSQKINATTLSNGIYMWELVSGNDIPAKGKIVIMK